MGASKIQEIILGILPQVMPLWTSFTLYGFESNVRSGCFIFHKSDSTVYVSIRIQNDICPTLPRFYFSKPIDSSAMNIQRRISVIFKDVPGGQYLNNM